MPATAGRVRMPADNRLSVSDSLKSSEIWQKSVGYDPYAPGGGSAPPGTGTTDGVSDIEAKAKGLFALARLTGGSSTTTPGACRRCGQVGHLAFQCRNDMAFLFPSGKNSTGPPASNLHACAVSSSDDEEEDEELTSMDNSSSASSSSRSSSSSSTPRRRKRQHRHSKHRSKKSHSHRSLRSRRHSRSSSSSSSESSSPISGRRPRSTRHKLRHGDSDSRGHRLRSGHSRSHRSRSYDRSSVKDRAPPPESAPSRGRSPHHGRRKRSTERLASQSLQGTFRHRACDASSSRAQRATEGNRHRSPRSIDRSIRSRPRKPYCA